MVPSFSQVSNRFQLIHGDLTIEHRCELAHYAFACDVIYCNFFCVTATDLVHHYTESHQQPWSSHSSDLLCLSDACHTHDGRRHQDNTTASHDHSHSHSQSHSQSECHAHFRHQEGRHSHHVASVECQVCQAAIKSFWEYHRRDASGQSEPTTVKPSVHSFIQSVLSGTEHEKG